MNRRDYLRFFAGITFTGLAGCGTTVPKANLAMTPLEKTDLLENVLKSSRQGERERQINRRVRLFEQLVNGTAISNGTRPLFSNNTHILDENTVYQVSYKVIRQTPVTGYRVRIEPVETTVNGSKTIPVRELPAVDQKKLTDRGLLEWDANVASGKVLYSDAEIEQSVLVPESNDSVVISRNGSQARWIIEATFDETLNTYRYTGDEIASAPDYRRDLIDRFVFTLSGLSDAERSIIETAITEDGYVIGSDETVPPAFRSLVDRFRNQEQVRPLNKTPWDEVGGNYLASYDGTVHYTFLHVISDEI